MLQRLLILGVPILIAGVLGGLVAAFAGLTGTAYELAEAATVLIAGPLILLHAERNGHLRIHS